MYFTVPPPQKKIITRVHETGANQIETLPKICNGKFIVSSNTKNLRKNGKELCFSLKQNPEQKGNVR